MQINIRSYYIHHCEMQLPRWNRTKINVLIQTFPSLNRNVDKDDNKLFWRVFFTSNLRLDLQIEESYDMFHVSYFSGGCPSFNPSPMGQIFEFWYVIKNSTHHLSTLPLYGENMCWSNKVEWACKLIFCLFRFLGRHLMRVVKNAFIIDFSLQTFKKVYQIIG